MPTEEVVPASTSPLEYVLMGLKVRPREKQEVPTIFCHQALLRGQSSIRSSYMPTRVVLVLEDFVLSQQIIDMILAAPVCLFTFDCTGVCTHVGF